MIKIRNKRIALLLVLAMLATMFVGFGTASAADAKFDISSTYKWVEPEDEGVDIGTVTVFDKSAWAEVYGDVDTLFVEIQVPDELDDYDWDYGLVNGTWNFDSMNSNDSTLIFYCDTPPSNCDLTIDFYDADIDEDASGNLNAAVKVYADVDGTESYIQEESVPIAKIESGEIKLSCDDPTTVTIGDEEEGATITVKESSISAFANPGDDGKLQKVKFTIQTANVSWDPDINDFPEIVEDWAVTSYCELEPPAGPYDPLDVDGKALTLYLIDDPAKVSTLDFTPYLKVNPAASGDVLIKVTGTNITSQTYTVATIGDPDDVKVTVKNPDKDFVYRGQVATFDDVQIKVNPQTVLDEEDWFSLTLPTGCKFVWDGETRPIDDSEDSWKLHYEGLMKSDTTVWYTVDEDTDIDDTFKLTDLWIAADANAAVGDLEVTFDGAIEGSYKIGSIKNAFTIETAPFSLQTSLTAIDGVNIVIKETADGALKASEDGYDLYGDVRDKEDESYKEYGWFDIVLPAGLTFVDTPEVEVTSGDIEIDEDSIEIGEDFRTLEFWIEDASNLVSTITISGVKYSVLSQPGIGTLNANIAGEYNIVSDKALEVLKVGEVTVNPTSVYVIGASTFTVNGAVQSVVTPSYIKNGRTYLAIRDIATGLGIDPMNVLWDAAASKVTLIKGAKIVQVQIGSNVMTINGVAVAMDVAPEISNGRAMLPAAFIAQAFGATASWDAATQTVTIK